MPSFSLLTSLAGIDGFLVILQQINYSDGRIPRSTSTNQLQGWKDCALCFNKSIPGIEGLRVILQQVNCRDRRTARYTSTNQLLTYYIEKNESRVKFAGGRTAFKLSTEMIGAIFALDMSGIEELYLTTTVGRYLLTGHSYPHLTGQNDFEVQEGQSPGLIVQFSGSEATCLLVCTASHTYVHHGLLRRRSLPSCFDWKK